MIRNKPVNFFIISILSLLPVFSIAQNLNFRGNNYYKEIFLDCGINLTGEVDLPQARFLDLEFERLISASQLLGKPTIMDTIVQKEMICSNPWDTNGVLLYPDGAPRFRILYICSGDKEKHMNSLTLAGRANIKKFADNGGAIIELPYLDAIRKALESTPEPTIKRELEAGQTIEVNKRTGAKDSSLIRIGDLQYHHFTINIPPATGRAIISIKGYKDYEHFQLSLMAKPREFAYHQNTDIKNVSEGCTKELVIEEPQAGKWYVSVRCENTVETSEGKYGTQYTKGREVLNGVPYSIKVEFDSQPHNTVASRDIVRPRENSSNRNGFYKDLLMDSGIQLYDRKYLAAACHLQTSYEVFLRTQNTLRDTLMQQRCFAGWEEDTNGALLYPDGAPRFRMIYVNGGLAGSHGRSLGEKGRKAIRQFVAAGGSYLGTCAGAFLASQGYYDDDNIYKKNNNYLAIWPGRVRDTYLQDKYFTLYMDKESPLLKYYDFGGDHKIENVLHFNGPRAALDESDCTPANTKPLLKVDYDTLPPVGPSLDNAVLCWSYKPNQLSGTTILMSSHPEDITTGERLHLMSAFLQLAMDGNGTPVVKGRLIPGQTRHMCKDTEDKDPLFTKIGDRQYHHFIVDIPHNTKKVEIQLEGYAAADNFDLSLSACKNDFAFHRNTQLKDVSLGCYKTLTIENPQEGEWYIAVFCETAPVAGSGDNGFIYSARTDVLNGVPYKIKVNIIK